MFKLRFFKSPLLLGAALCAVSGTSQAAFEACSGDSCFSIEAAGPINNVDSITFTLANKSKDNSVLTGFQLGVNPEGAKIESESSVIFDQASKTDGVDTVFDFCFLNKDDPNQCVGGDPNAGLQPTASEEFTIVFDRDISLIALGIRFQRTGQDGQGSLKLLYDCENGKCPGVFNECENGDCNVVPLPAAAWLFASGLVGLAGAARRRAKSTQS